MCNLPHAGNYLAASGDHSDSLQFRESNHIQEDRPAIQYTLPAALRELKELELAPFLVVLPNVRAIPFPNAVLAQQGVCASERVAFLNG